ncbi:endonuclease VII domain-containing protein [Actinoplanes sp. CA-142083]|uniref:endonuclease VII domain-containing protein n=1 Tax=Actinoplanes sp. CA-142083 TaxID=3239903 RepID=UPI003D8D9346
MFEPDVRRCPRCHQNRPGTAFRSASGRPTQSCSACLERSRLTNRVRRAGLGPAGRRADNLRHKYGLLPEEYDALRAAQEYRCQICGVHEDDIEAPRTGRPRSDGSPATEGVRLVVDHCHRTGRVRGLLCAGCNVMIGNAADSPEILLAAAAYLSRDAEPAPRPQLARLRILDTVPDGRPSRTVQFRGSVTIRLDGHEVHVAEGSTTTVVSPTGNFEVIT